MHYIKSMHLFIYLGTVEKIVLFSLLVQMVESGVESEKRLVYSTQ